MFVAGRATVEYKYIVKNEDGSIKWQPGSNIELDLPNEAETVDVLDCWLGVNRKVPYRSELSGTTTLCTATT